MQKENNSDNCQGDRLIATRYGNNPVQRVQLHDGCLNREFKCQSMNLNARCAKSVLRWISQSTRNGNQSAAGQT